MFTEQECYKNVYWARILLQCLPSKNVITMFSGQEISLHCLLSKNVIAMFTEQECYNNVY
jgi:hypothetical protein